jgi:hypothetical protein
VYALRTARHGSDSTGSFKQSIIDFFSFLTQSNSSMHCNKLSAASLQECGFHRINRHWIKVTT